MVRVELSSIHLFQSVFIIDACGLVWVNAIPYRRLDAEYDNSTTER